MESIRYFLAQARGEEDMPMSHVPYTNNRIADLAKAIGIKSSQFWVNPITSTLEIRENVENEDDSELDLEEDGQ